MSLIAWSQKLAVGHAEIDAQHQKLIALLNKLHDQMIAGGAKDVVGRVLDDVVEYTNFHFVTEERLMAEAGYPMQAAHKMEHAKLLQQALELQQRYKAGKVTIAIDVLHFLRDWLNQHILASDKALATHLARPAKAVRA